VATVANAQYSQDSHYYKEFQTARYGNAKIKRLQAVSTENTKVDEVEAPVVAEKVESTEPPKKDEKKQERPARPIKKAKSSNTIEKQSNNPSKVDRDNRDIRVNQVKRGNQERQVKEVKRVNQEKQAKEVNKVKEEKPERLSPKRVKAQQRREKVETRKVKQASVETV